VTVTVPLPTLGFTVTITAAGQVRCPCNTVIYPTEGCDDHVLDAAAEEVADIEAALLDEPLGPHPAAAIRRLIDGHIHRNLFPDLLPTARIIADRSFTIEETNHLDPPDLLEFLRIAYLADPTRTVPTLISHPDTPSDLLKAIWEQSHEHQVAGHPNCPESLIATIIETAHPTELAVLFDHFPDAARRWQNTPIHHLIEERTDRPNDRWVRQRLGFSTTRTGSSPQATEHVVDLLRLHRNPTATWTQAAEPIERNLKRRVGASWAQLPLFLLAANPETPADVADMLTTVLTNGIAQPRNTRPPPDSGERHFNAKSAVGPIRYILEGTGGRFSPSVSALHELFASSAPVADLFSDMFHQVDLLRLEPRRQPRQPSADWLLPLAPLTAALAFDPTRTGPTVARLCELTDSFSPHGTSLWAPPTTELVSVIRYILGLPLPALLYAWFRSHLPTPPLPASWVAWLTPRQVVDLASRPVPERPSQDHGFFEPHRFREGH
jgi:hypothetical protein